VRVTPRGRRDVVEGFAADADGRPRLRVRLAAAPVEGAANTALIALLAKAIGVRKSDVTIVSGETAREKIVAVRGDVTAIVAWAEGLSGTARRTGPDNPPSPRT
jgi:uncharacterized protein (TIGR00251 family)